MKAKFGQVKVFDISPHSEEKRFSENVCKILDIERSDVDVLKFKDKDTDIDIMESVRGLDVFVFQSYVEPLGERLYELNQFIDAALYGGYATRVIVVMPFSFGSRGERRTRARQSIPALVAARGFKVNGAWGVLTAGIHTTAIGTVFNAVGLGFENLELEYIAANYVINHYKERVALGSPDAGGAKRVEKIIDIVNKNSSIDTSLVIGHKVRKRANEIAKFQIIGDVKDYDVLWIDDIGDTLGTIYNAVAESKEQGAKNVKALLYHPVLGEGFEKNLEAMLESGVEFVFANSIPLNELAKGQPQIKQIALEPFFAEAILRMNQNISISGLHRYKEIIKVYEKYREIYEGKEEFVETKISNRGSRE